MEFNLKDAISLAQSQAKVVLAQKAVEESQQKANDLRAQVEKDRLDQIFESQKPNLLLEAKEEHQLRMAALGNILEHFKSPMEQIRDTYFPDQRLFYYDSYVLESASRKKILWGGDPPTVAEYFRALMVMRPVGNTSYKTFGIFAHGFEKYKFFKNFFRDKTIYPDYTVSAEESQTASGDLNSLVEKLSEDYQVIEIPANQIKVARLQYSNEARFFPSKLYYPRWSDQLQRNATKWTGKPQDFDQVTRKLQNIIYQWEMQKLRAAATAS